jgi:hypothetical protein
MREDLELKLISKYPSVFRDYNGDLTKTAMCCGMSCGNGWYDLIDSLCQRIVELDPEKKCYAIQVKEKFGTLRFYVGNASNEIHDAIEEAERKSSIVCERCGGEGKTRNDRGWLRTLCEKCKV